MIYSIWGYIMSYGHKERCKYGHLYGADARWQTNWKGYQCRVCRECARLRMQQRRESPEAKAEGARRTAKWRQAHPEKYRAGWQRTEAVKKQVLLEARAGGCIQCGEKRTPCLDFHHRQGSDKLGNIGEFRKFGIQRLKAEIAKCDVLCANCHRWHHELERRQRRSTITNSLEG